MREAVRQGFYPGGLTPYGYCKVAVEVHAGKKPRYHLAVQPDEAAILRTMYRLYITGSSALKVAEALNALGERNIGEVHRMPLPGGTRGTPRWAKRGMGSAGTRTLGRADR